MSEEEKNKILIRLKEGVEPRDIISAEVNGFSFFSDSSLDNLKLNRLYNIKLVVEKEKNENFSLLDSNLSDEEIFKNLYNNMSETEKKLYRTYEIEVKNSINVDELLNNLNKNNNIEYAEIDQPLMLYADFNDPRFNELYGLKNMQCEKAWDISQGENIIVAVIDSGVDYNHPDIRANMWRDENGKYGYDFSKDDDNPMDDFSPIGDGHGTHVAGTIAAVANNETGIIGVAPKVKIMVLKIFPNASDSIAAKALTYAVEHGAKIINNSWGPISPRDSISNTLKVALDNAYEKGAIVVFAAGNNNDNINNYPPANYKKVISVSAVDENDEKASYSNYGDVIDIAAPGSGILSLKARSEEYIIKNGTSMAAPHVSGLIALMLAKKPSLTFEEVRTIIKESSDKVHSDKPIGSGRVNAYRALNHQLLETVDSTRELVGTGIR